MITLPGSLFIGAFSAILLSTTVEDVGMWFGLNRQIVVVATATLFAKALMQAATCAGAVAAALAAVSIADRCNHHAQRHKHPCIPSVPMFQALLNFPENLSLS